MVNDTIGLSFDAHQGVQIFYRDQASPSVLYTESASSKMAAIRGSSSIAIYTRSVLHLVADGATAYVLSLQRLTPASSTNDSCISCIMPPCV